MKKTKNFKAILKIAGIIAFVAIIGFGMTACGGGSSHKDYIGTWSTDYGVSETVSAKEITTKDRDNWKTMTIDSVTPMKDDNDPNYPRGLRFDGKITAAEGYMVSSIGLNQSITLWLHTGKKEIFVNSNKNPYKKQK